MNKTELIDVLAAHFEGNRKAAAHALDSVLDVITREVARGEKVAITGFGSFEKRVREARLVRNPRTGEKKMADRISIPKFNPGADLKSVVAGVRELPKLAYDTAATVAATALPGGRRKTPVKVVTDAVDATTPTTPAKKSAAKKTTAKKAVAKKAPAAKKTAAKTTAAAPAAKKTTAKKTVAKKAPAAKTTTAAPAAEKTTPKKAVAKKTAAKKAPAKTATKTTAAAPAAKRTTPTKTTTTAKTTTAAKRTAEKAPATTSTAAAPAETTAAAPATPSAPPATPDAG